MSQEKFALSVKAPQGSESFRVSGAIVYNSKNRKILARWKGGRGTPVTQKWGSTYKISTEQNTLLSVKFTSGSLSKQWEFLIEPQQPNDTYVFTPTFESERGKVTCRITGTKKFSDGRVVKLRPFTLQPKDTSQPTLHSLETTDYVEVEDSQSDAQETENYLIVDPTEEE